MPRIHTRITLILNKMAKSKWKFRQDDLDTILTVINQGLMKKPYWVEFHDTYADGTPVWNGEVRVVEPDGASIPSRGACANDETNNV